MKTFFRFGWALVGVILFIAFICFMYPGFMQSSNKHETPLDAAINKQKKAVSASYNKSVHVWNDAVLTHPAHIYMEKPAMAAELPATLAGKTVLCIGVGSGGHELKNILEKKPARVVGIDISSGLLKMASEKHPSVVFQEMDMNNMSFVDGTFDVIYSSLALHYSPDWDVLLKEIHRTLKPGGTLLFSTHHPGFWALKPATGNAYTNDRGITLKEHIGTVPGDIKVTYYNHPNEGSIKDALEYAGFNIVSSFTPSVKGPEEKKETYEWLEKENKESPIFLIVKAQKKS